MPQIKLRENSNKDSFKEKNENKRVPIEMKAKLNNIWDAGGIYAKVV